MVREIISENNMYVDYGVGVVWEIIRMYMYM